jgi:hypothetical protein
MTFHLSPEKKQAASKSPPPTFQAKKSKAREESKGPNQVSDHWRRDTGIRNSTSSYEIPHGSRFGIFEFY